MRRAGSVGAVQFFFRSRRTHLKSDV